MIVEDFTIGFLAGWITAGVFFYFYGLRVLGELSDKKYILGVRHGKEQSAWAAFIVANKLADKEL